MKKDIVEVRNRLSLLWRKRKISTAGYQRALQKTLAKMTEADKARELKQIEVK